MPDFAEFNWLAILAAVVVTQILGFLWYGPLFGKPWMAGMGKTQEEIQAGGNVGKAVAIGVICSIVMTVSLAIVILELSATPDLTSGIKIGLLASIGFVATTLWSGAIYEDRNMTVTIISIAYQVVAITAAGAIIGGWR